MNAKQAKVWFKYLNGLWPKWTPTAPEQAEWGRVLDGVDEQIIKAVISEFFETFGRYDRPNLPDFMPIARRITSSKKAVKQGVRVCVERVSDKYRMYLTVFDTQDPDRIMVEACKFRDYLMKITPVDEWRVIRPETAEAA